MSTRKRNVEKLTEKEGDISATFRKALQPAAEWPDKDEFLDVVYWMRQIVGVILGVLWGIIPVSGVVGLVAFFAVNSLVVYLYFNSFQKVDEEEFGGMMEILKEGLMTSFATFLVSWIILYSALHFN